MGSPPRCSSLILRLPPQSACQPPASLTPRSPPCSAAAARRPSGSPARSAAPASPGSGGAWRGSGTGCCSPRGPTKQPETRALLTPSRTHTSAGDEQRATGLELSPGALISSFFLPGALIRAQRGPGGLPRPLPPATDSAQGSADMEPE